MNDKEKNVIDLLKNIDKQKCLMLNCPVVKNNIKRQLKIIELNKIIRKQSKQIDEREFISRDEVEKIIKVKIEEYEEKFKAENGKKTINYHLYRIIIDEVLKPLLDKIKGDD